MKPQRSLCYSQKVQLTDGTISFSILGLSIILTVGFMIIFTSIFLATIVGYIQRKFHKREHAWLSWLLDDKFQLQRMAFEEARMGDWQRLSDIVPVTKYGQLFGGWGAIPPHNPRLKQDCASYVSKVEETRSVISRKPVGGGSIFSTEALTEIEKVHMNATYRENPGYEDGFPL
jgi:hypothetical protein